MSDTTPHDTKPTDHESEADAAKRKAGQTDKSSNEHMSRTKAGSDEGAGGGAKQEQKH